MVLMRPTDQAMIALEASIADYHARTEHPVRLLRGSMPGVMHGGVEMV